MFQLLLAATALAAAAPSHYAAQPALKAADAKIVMKDIIWYCGDSGCTAGKSASRPAIVCAALVKQVGRLRSFSVAGAPLPATDLEKCNGRAG